QLGPLGARLPGRGSARGPAIAGGVRESRGSPGARHLAEVAVDRATELGAPRRLDPPVHPGEPAARLARARRAPPRVVWRAAARAATASDRGAPPRCGGRRRTERKDSRMRRARGALGGVRRRSGATTAAVAITFVLPWTLIRSGQPRLAVGHGARPE